MSEFTEIRIVEKSPRIPLTGTMDITYRCNFNCRHCWVRIPQDSPEEKRELTLEEIKSQVLEARMMGCREWRISGGEPMLRPDFPEIMDFITRHVPIYGLNTNGALINPQIARLLARKGDKMVALYGATPEVCDHVTRTPGSFEAVMQGMAYLREAGANFTVQIIPMRDNFYQLQEMIDLAKKHSDYYRIGAPWLYLSAYGDEKTNREIKKQRLRPEQVVMLDQPDVTYEGYYENEAMVCSRGTEGDYLFTPCIAGREEFHIDAYDQFSFCCFIKDPSLQLDLRTSSLREAWEGFLPSKAYSMPAQGEYQNGCKRCDLRATCRWCPAYGYLEHRRFEAKVNYLCRVTKETQKHKINWIAKNRRYYQIAGLTLQVEADLPLTEETFHPKFKQFEVKDPGDDVISIRHYFTLPDLNGNDLGREVYRKVPWAIYRKGEAWIYVGISPDNKFEPVHKVAVFNQEHTRCRIYAPSEVGFRNGGLDSLAGFQTDQIMLARVLADRKGCYFHAGGVILNGQGLLFIGHSGAGKSTLLKMLRGHAEILCDDRLIVRRWDEGFRLHGTWSHGELPDISANSAPLKAVMFLSKSKYNRIVRLENDRKLKLRLLQHLIKPLETADWWRKMLDLIETISGEVPCYTLGFDKSGAVLEVLQEFAGMKDG